MNNINSSDSPTFDNFDSVTYESKYETYFFFKGKYYWSKDKGGKKDAKGPYKTASEWSVKIPKKIIASCYNRGNSHYYFFSKDHSGQMECTSLKQSTKNDSKTSRLSIMWGQSMPKTFDAICYNKTDDVTYIFSGSNYSKKPWGEKAEDTKSITKEWGAHTPTDMDAVCYNSDTETYYFFVGSNFYTRERTKDTESKARPVSKF